MFWHYVFGWLVSAHPLKTDESEVHIMNITTGNGTNQNNSCLILQDLYNLVHNLDPFYLPRNNCQSYIPITEIRSSCRLEPFPQGRDTKAKFRGWTGTFCTAGYIANPDLAQIMGLIWDVDCMTHVTHWTHVIWIFWIFFWIPNQTCLLLQMQIRHQIVKVREYKL